MDVYRIYNIHLVNGGNINQQTCHWGGTTCRNWLQLPRDASRSLAPKDSQRRSCRVWLRRSSNIVRQNGGPILQLQKKSTSSPLEKPEASLVLQATALLYCSRCQSGCARSMVTKRSHASLFTTGYHCEKLLVDHFPRTTRQVFHNYVILPWGNIQCRQQCLVPKHISQPMTWVIAYIGCQSMLGAST